jgi:hypothetical protein
MSLFAVWWTLYPRSGAGKSSADLAADVDGRAPSNELLGPDDPASVKSSDRLEEALVARGQGRLGG